MSTEILHIIMIDKNYYVSEQEVTVSEPQQEAKDPALNVQYINGPSKCPAQISVNSQSFSYYDIFQKIE